MRRWLGVLSVLGGITAVPLMLAFTATGFGEPGTAAYETYEQLNRLMAVSLLLMTAGWLGAWRAWPGGPGRWAAAVAFVGSLVVVAGNAAEFWLFSDLPYAVAGNGRDLSWMAFSIGSLVMDIGATLLGVAAWRSRFWPRWSAALLMAALPLDMVAFFTVSPFLAPAVLAVAIGYLLYAGTALKLSSESGQL